MGLGQGANIANACFFMYQGTKPIGGILAYDGMIPFNWASIEDETNPKFSVMGETPFLATNAGKNPTLPFKTAQASYTYYRNYVYTSPTGKAIWKL